jgi:hypothetical protein
MSLVDLIVLSRFTRDTSLARLAAELLFDRSTTLLVLATSSSVLATTLLSGNWIAILTALLVAVSLPLLLHHFLYRSSSAKRTNDFLLLGPSGSGKTAFCSLVLSPL